MEDINGKPLPAPMNKGEEYACAILAELQAIRKMLAERGAVNNYNVTGSSTAPKFIHINRSLDDEDLSHALEELTCRAPEPAPLPEAAPKPAPPAKSKGKR